ncbi:hypothetical protein ccbrp13_20180 [Ktedonobacteria bacterium brp13]|nr:hypothetical protein ccbrp13_20180 [Ktedonobacteria bacterium brp13]
MKRVIIMNMDRYSLEYEAVLLLAKELHLEEEDINEQMYNLWIDEKHTTASQPAVLKLLEDWFARFEQSAWEDVAVVVTIAREDIDIIALRTVRAWFALKANHIPHLYWLPLPALSETYREFVEKNTHPGSVSLDIAPEATIVPVSERGNRIIVKKIYTVALTAEAFVKGTLDVEVNPTFSERAIEQVALEQSDRITWLYHGLIRGTEHVETIKHIGDVTA